MPGKHTRLISPKQNDTKQTVKLALNSKYFIVSYQGPIYDIVCNSWLFIGKTFDMFISSMEHIKW